MLKKIIKNIYGRYFNKYFPVQAYWIKKIYLNSFMNKIIQNRYKKKIGYAKRDRRLKKEKYILRKCFKNELRVRYGPFKGMKYISEAYGSTILPKILGSYEEPLHKWINEIPAKKYNKIIDIGSAEGYYVVGLGRNLSTTIVGFEINKLAIEANESLKSLNKDIKSEIRLINKECNIEELKKEILEERVLIICDIEGFEKVLLDPIKIPKLKEVDIIVEVHEVLQYGIFFNLMERFSLTHKIEVVIDYPRNINRYPMLKDFNLEEVEMIVDERKPKNMMWMRMTSLKNEQVVLPLKWRNL